MQLLTFALIYLQLYIAETIIFAASRPDHVNIADIVIYPVNQVKDLSC